MEIEEFIPVQPWTLNTVSTEKPSCVSHFALGVSRIAQNQAVAKEKQLLRTYHGHFRHSLQWRVKRAERDDAFRSLEARVWPEVPAQSGAHAMLRMQGLTGN